MRCETTHTSTHGGKVEKTQLINEKISFETIDPIRLKIKQLKGKIVLERIHYNDIFESSLIVTPYAYGAR